LAPPQRRVCSKKGKVYWICTGGLPGPSPHLVVPATGLPKHSSPLGLKKYYPKVDVAIEVPFWQIFPGTEVGQELIIIIQSLQKVELASLKLIQ
jgi:hypothetical protein